MKYLPTVCFINPNSTVSMTDTCRHTLDRIDLGSFPIFEFVTNGQGPAAIQGARDGEFATEAMLELAEELPDHYGTFVVGCFDDTGVERLLDKVRRPVIGIGQAAYHWASLLSQRFVVLTTLDVSVPVIRESIQRQGFDSQCIDVIASGIPVLEIEQQPYEALSVLDDLIRANVNSHGEDVALILGCAGMTELHQELSSRWAHLNIIDPVASGLRLSSVLCQKVRLQ